MDLIVGCRYVIRSYPALEVKYIFITNCHVSTGTSINHIFKNCIESSIFITTRQVTRATHVRNRVCPRVELILKIIIILLIIFLGFIKSKPC